MRGRSVLSALTVVFISQACSSSDGTGPANTSPPTNTGGGNTGDGSTITQCVNIAAPIVTVARSLWTQHQATGAAPAARIQHAGVYDAANDRLIVFGGFAAAGALNDVWVLLARGRSWHQRALRRRPGAQ
jgi:hypothetical protein